MTRRGLSLAAAMSAVMAVGVGSAMARHGYRTTPGPRRAPARFAISYTGSGTWATSYHATPPNPGGAPDNDTGHDSSAERWSLRYTGVLTLPQCRPGAGSADPCRGIVAPQTATGQSSVTGNIDHVHIDGLYSDLNASEHCQVVYRSPVGQPVSAGLGVVYSPGTQTISLTAQDPLHIQLQVMPQTCPGDGDPIDGFDANYFIPGFSFDSAYGPDRWFTSAATKIPVARLDRSSQLTIPLHETSAGTPPRDCAVPNPSYQQCSTGGSWHGTLTLRRQ